MEKQQWFLVASHILILTFLFLLRLKIPAQGGGSWRTSMVGLGNADTVIIEPDALAMLESHQGLTQNWSNFNEQYQRLPMFGLGMG